MAYQPGSFTSQGYTPGMSEEERKKRKAAAAQNQASLPPVNSYTPFLTPVRQMMSQQEQLLKERGVVGAAQEMGGNIAKSVGTIAYGSGSQGQGQSAAAARPSSPVIGPALAAINKNIFPDYSVQNPNPRPFAPTTPMPGNSAPVGPRAQPAPIAAGPAPAWYNTLAGGQRAGGGTQADIDLAKQRYADFNAKTNANYQAMRESMAQGKPGYTPPQRVQSEKERGARQERMQRESGEQRIAADQREQAQKLELGKQAGEYRVREQEAASRGQKEVAGITAASEERRTKIQADATKLTGGNIVEYAKLIKERMDTASPDQLPTLEAQLKEVESLFAEKFQSKGQQNDEAVKWARANPKDPRSAAILAKLGIKG